MQLRTYLLGRRFRLRTTEDTMGVDVIDRQSFSIPETDWEIGSIEEMEVTIGDAIAALWRRLTARQPGGFIKDKIRRVRAVITFLQHLWIYLSTTPGTSRYFYEKELQFLTFLRAQDPAWRGPRAGQYHIAYEDPSQDPRWRMKQIVEFVDDRDKGRRFLISGSNLAW